MGRSVHTPAYKALLETLIKAREAAGLTQVELVEFVRAIEDDPVHILRGFLRRSCVGL